MDNFGLEQQPSTSGHKLVVLGDSIVYGWGVLRRQSYVYLLQEALAHDVRFADWQVIGAGVPGDTALMGVSRFTNDVALHEPDAVLIAFGLNDGALSRSSIDQQRERLFLARTQPWWRAWFLLRRAVRLFCKAWSIKPPNRPPVVHENEPRMRPEMFQAGLRYLIRATRQLGAEPLLLGLLPRHKARLSVQQNAAYQAFADRLQEIAQVTDTPLLDPEPPDQDAAYHMPDGVHLTPEGHAWLAAQVYTQITKVLTP